MSCHKLRTGRVHIKPFSKYSFYTRIVNFYYYVHSLFLGGSWLPIFILILLFFISFLIKLDGLIGTLPLLLQLKMYAVFHLLYDTFIDKGEKPSASFTFTIYNSIVERQTNLSIGCLVYHFEMLTGCVPLHFKKSRREPSEKKNDSFLYRNGKKPCSSPLLNSELSKIMTISFVSIQ